MATGRILFENATIISYDEAANAVKILRAASLLVTDGHIAEVAEGKLSNIPDGTEIFDATGRIISPGFVNTHHHMWQSQFRTLGANTTLAEYLAGRYSQTGPAGKNFTPDDIYLGQITCALEMIDGGTTTVLDHAHGTFSDEHIDAAVDASFESGLRIVFGHNLQDIDTAGYTIANGIEKLFRLATDPRFLDQEKPVELGVGYDGWLFAPAEANASIMNAIVNHNNVASSQSLAPISVLTAHMVAGPYGFNNNPAKLESPPASALTQPTLTTPAKIPIILSHASFITDDDAQIIRKHPRVSISTTPESESHYGHTSTGSDQCQDCASLGVDTHFTYSSYMPFQARLWLQSLRYRRYSDTLIHKGQVPMTQPMAVESAFLLMTLKGAQALGRHDIGIIKPGAKADLVIFNTQTRPSLWAAAAHDPIAAIVLHTGSGGDIEAVMVQGKWLKKDHKILDLISAKDGKPFSAESIRLRFERSASRIQGLWNDIPRPVFVEGERFLVGAEYGPTSTVDVRRGV